MRDAVKFLASSLVMAAAMAAVPARAADAAGPDPAAMQRVLDAEDARPPGGGALVGLSHAPSPTTVRARAVRALGRLQDAAVAPALLTALEKDPEAAVRAEAAFALGLLPGVDTKRLAAAFHAGRAQIALVEAIGRQGGPEDVPFLLEIAASDLRRPVMVALGLIAKRNEGKLAGVPDALLTSSVESEPFGVAYILMRSTGWEEGRVLPLARRLVAHTDPEVRAMACRALAGRPAGVPVLQRAAEDPDWRVRVEAVRALGKSKASAALALVTLQAAARHLRDNDPDALAGPALHPLTEALDAALTLPDTPVLTAAAEAVLSAVGTPGEVVPAGVALGRSHLRCRAAALVDRARGELTRLPVCADPTLPPFVREGLTAPLLARLPEAGRDAALSAFWSAASPAGRGALLDAVEPDSPASFKARVLPALSENDPAVVASAAGAAGRLNDPTLATPLIEALKRTLAAGDQETAQSVLEAMATLKLTQASDLLAPLAASPHAALRKAARTTAEALGVTLAPAQAAEHEVTPLDAGPAPKRARISTTKGVLVVEFNAAEAPRTVENFARLARKGYYDGQLFHRVVPDFVAQGGDPRGDGWGGPGYTIRCELNPLPYVRGAMGMALAGQDTGGSQFFFMHTAHPHLTAGYTVFGQLSAGGDVLDALAVGDRIKSVQIE